MTNFVLHAKVRTSEGIEEEETLNLLDIVISRPVDISNGNQYLSDKMNPLGDNYAASGGQLFPSQSIVKKNVMYSSQVSFNLRIRYDPTDSEDKRWKLDVYFDIHDKDLPKNERIGTRHFQKIHHIQDAETIQVEWSINGTSQPTMKLTRPQPNHP